MELQPGTKVGPYELLSLLGAGAMGDVYRAHDPRLNREAAIKVLPRLASSDPDRLARFQREARATAALNHPNILAIFDVGTFADDRPYIVSELLEGQTLRRLLDSANLSASRAAEIGSQIARGLAAAHARGILHRDLKPENVFVTRDGRVKILDFGLAKLLEPPESIETGVGTEPGLVMGTAGYMAPEQASGLAVDQRTDIFALGAILYELFSGHRAFQGPTRTDVLTSVIKDDPPPLAGPDRNVSPLVERIVRRCLEKEPDARFHAASDLAFALEGVAHSTSASGPVVTVSSRRRWPAWVAAAGAVVAAFAAGWALRPAATAAPARPLVQFSLEVDPSATWGVSAGANSIALSPDGAAIAYAPPGRDRELMYRRFDRSAATPLASTAGGRQPFFSPDGQWLGFYVRATKQLKRVSVATGVVAAIVDAADLRGAAWGADDYITYANREEGVLRVAVAGGALQRLFPPAPDSYLAWPSLLPDGKTLLLTRRAGFGIETGTIVALPSGSGTPRDLVTNGSDALFAAGRLFFGRGVALWSVPFDPIGLEIKGSEEIVLDRLERAGGNGDTEYAISATGSLAYLPFQTRAARTVELVDQTGRGAPIGTDLSPGNYSFPTVSPDGSVVAVSNGYDSLLLVIGLAGQRTVRIPVGGVGNGLAWLDPNTILFPGGSTYPTVSSVRADGIGRASTAIPPSNSPQDIMGVTRAGEILYIDQSDPSSLRIHVPAGHVRSVVIPARSGFADLSPDNRWLVTSNFDGEVTIQSFDDFARRSRIAGTFRQPQWSSDGRQVFLLRPGLAGERGAVFAVRVTPGATLEVSAPRELFPCERCAQFTPTHDGRFVVLRQTSQVSSPASINVILNWPALIGSGPPHD